MALTFTNDILKFRESPSDPWEMLLIQANMNFNLIYPVGSIYMSTVNVDPGTIFGGTWEQLKDTFLLGAGDSYTAGDTGGEATHTLTTDEMPSHSHTIYTGAVGVNSNGGNAQRGLVSTTGADAGTNNTGGGQAHNNMPPYLVVYMWKRLTLSPSLTPLPMNVLGEVASEDIVPIAKGGTGADNAADARTNLGIDGLQLKFTSVNITLSQQTWTASGAGMYYIATSAAIPIPGATQVVAVSLNADWSGLRKTDVIIPYINNNKVSLLSNVNSFHNSSSLVGVTVLYY